LVATTCDCAQIRQNLGWVFITATPLEQRFFAALRMTVFLIRGILKSYKSWFRQNSPPTSVSDCRGLARRAGAQRSPEKPGPLCISGQRPIIFPINLHTSLTCSLSAAYLPAF